MYRRYRCGDRECVDVVVDAVVRLSVNDPLHHYGAFWLTDSIVKYMCGPRSSTVVSYSSDPGYSDNNCSANYADNSKCSNYYCAPVLGVFDSDPNPNVVSSACTISPLVAFRPWNYGYCNYIYSSKNVVKTLYLNGYGCTSGSFVYASFSGVDDSDAEYTATWLALLEYWCLYSGNPNCYWIFSKARLPAPVVKTSSTTVRYVYRVGFPLG